MTYKEALDVLMHQIQIDVRYTTDFERDRSCLYKCKEALEKQIPKEPEYETLSNGDFYVYCPTCGEVVMCDLVDSPILNEYNHSHCGWNWTGEPEKITRVPFGGNTDTLINKDSIPLSWNGTSTGWDSTNLATSSTITAFGTKACENCSSNPKNGGDGICFCTLGQINVVY